MVVLARLKIVLASCKERRRNRKGRRRRGRKKRTGRRSTRWHGMIVNRKQGILGRLRNAVKVMA